MVRATNAALGAVAGAAGVGFVAGVATGAARKVAAQAITTAGNADWLEALKSEHKQAAAVFEMLEKTTEKDTGKRKAGIQKLEYALTKHGIEEENVIYPALRQADQEAAAKHLYDDHSDIKTFIFELKEMEKDDPQWLPKLQAFYALIKEHVREEEEEIYPAFKAKMSADQNAKLSKSMQIMGMKVG
jgi:hemerythrin superfamily protein